MALSITSRSGHERSGNHDRRGPSEGDPQQPLRAIVVDLHGDRCSDDRCHCARPSRDLNAVGARSQHVVSARLRGRTAGMPEMRVPSSVASLARETAASLCPDPGDGWRRRGGTGTVAALRCRRRRLRPRRRHRLHDDAAPSTTSATSTATTTPRLPSSTTPRGADHDDAADDDDDGPRSARRHQLDPGAAIPRRAATRPCSSSAARRCRVASGRARRRRCPRQRHWLGGRLPLVPRTGAMTTTQTTAVVVRVRPPAVVESVAERELGAAARDRRRRRTLVHGGLPGHRLRRAPLCRVSTVRRCGRRPPGSR